MRNSMKQILVALVMVAMTSIVALAKKERKTITFPSAIKISNTLVKQGTYEVTFDREAGELSVLKDGKVVAKTTARAEARERKAKTTEVVSSRNGEDASLVSIAFGGSKENIVVGQMSSRTGGNQ